MVTLISFEAKARLFGAPEIAHQLDQLKSYALRKDFNRKLIKSL